MGLIGSLLSWALFGLIVGAIARFLYPGRQPMSILMTMVLGVVGSFVGGFISYLFGYDPQDGALQGAGWIMSIIGAIIVVWIGLYAASQGAAGGRPTTPTV
jgi:uncharacterized membrane protein YeaQ/YmgE (transglycosylase-associated protein family)